MRFARWSFLAAGIWGIFICGVSFFNEQWIARNAPPALNHVEYFYGFNTVTLAWQILFLLIARDPARLRPAMPAAMLEKFGYIIAMVILFAVGRLSTPMLAFAAIDAAIGVLFVLSYVNTKECG
jgi:hypothetical protein